MNNFKSAKLASSAEGYANPNKSGPSEHNLQLMEGVILSSLIPDYACRAKLENLVVVGSNKCVWVQLDSECCEFVSPKDQDPGSYNGD